MHNISTGVVYCNGTSFAQSDTIQGKNGPMVSKVQWQKNELLVQPFWSNKIADPSQSEVDEQPLELARYTPLPLLHHLLAHAAKATLTAEYAMYSDTVGAMPVTVFIDKHDCLVKRIMYTQPHDMWGDVTTTVSYGQCLPGTKCPERAVVEKVHGIKDTVSFTAAAVAGDPMPVLLQRPEGYTVTPDEHKTPVAVTEKLRDHIYSINMPHTESMALLVEFTGFFVVLDAPLSSENGELVLAEARKIAPGKPVKYYAFGHHHPWALGGVRPFIRNGATVLSVPEDRDYVSFIANAPHTLKPDSLQMQHTPLKMEAINDSRTIADEMNELQILRIGQQSHHTNDYIIFYFPKEKLVFEGDLAWFPKEGPARKASERQAGLYQAIKDRKIVVDTIVQQWPSGDRYKLKSLFSFAELEQSVEMK
jgi:glyoxylase-like metal-dependent hydrolase (beta-lactamase superfamily II)